MELMVLGPLELRAGEDVVPVRRGRPRRLLLSLLLRAGEHVSSHTLIDELWDDEIPKNASNALQILVPYLRKTLGGHDDRPRIETVPGGYRLVLDGCFVDAHHFEEVVEGALELDAPSRCAALDGALGLWRGVPYSELSHAEFARGPIVRLEEMRLAALELRNDAMLELGLHRETIGSIRQLVAEHPLRERLRAQLILALYRSGRQADALRAYDEARSTLVDELGLDPGPELQELQRLVLAQDRSLAAPDPPTLVDLRASAAVAGPREPESHWAQILHDDTIGRSDALARLAELLRGRRMLTLTGPGGTGKTRLAAELLRDRSDVWWADLSPVADAEGVARTLAASTGSVLVHGPDGPGQLVEHLAERTGVLVLDTCEHVVDLIRPYVEGLLAGTQVRILATSRQPLRVRDELAWPVPPLGLPDPNDLGAAAVRSSPAAELVRRRAATVAGAFEITDANAADVGRICLQLDGLPLAIELAAGNAAVLSPAATVRLLDDRLRILSSRELSGRQHTLRETIAWSYDRLDPEEMVFLLRLSIFSGGFPLEAAVDVAGHGLRTDALDILLSLADQSLVARFGDERFRLLDTIQAFASERIETQDADRASARHAEWYCDFAQEANRHSRSADGPGWTAEVRLEVQNLRAALEWCFSGGDPALGVRIALSLSWFWAMEGLAAEAEHWLGLAAEVMEGEEGQIEARAALSSARGLHASSRGDLASSIIASQEAVDLYRSIGSVRGEANALIFLGVALWGSGRLDDAASAHDQAIAVCRETGMDWSLAMALLMRARTAIDRDEEQAADLLAAAISIARRSGDRHIVAMCLEQRARFAVNEGDAELALALAAESVELHEQLGHAEGTAASLHALGLALTAIGRVDEAAEAHVRGLTISLELDHPGGVADGMESLAVAASARAEHAKAIRLLAAADAYRADRAVPRPRSRRRSLAAVCEEAALVLADDEIRRATAAGQLLDPRTLVP